MVGESDKNKVFAVDGVKRIFINFFFFPSTKQHLVIMFGQAVVPPQTGGQDPSLRPTHRAARGKQASQFVEPQPCTSSFSLSLQETGTQNTTACKTQQPNCREGLLKGKEPAAWGVGVGETKVRATPHSGW